MDELTRELIAIGASVGAHCQPCLDYHVAKARELGAQDGQILAAVEVGRMVERGASAAMRQYTEISLGQARSPGGSCCPQAQPQCCG